MCFSVYLGVKHGYLIGCYICILIYTHNG